MGNTTRFPGSVPPAPQGGGGGRPQDRKSTAVRKVTPAAAPSGSARPGTRRMSRPGTGRAEREGDENGRGGYAAQGQAQAQEQSKTNLYIGIGVGALVLLIVVAVMMSGGDSGGSGTGGSGWVARQLGKAVEARDSGDYAKALQLCDVVMANSNSRKSSRYREVEILAKECRERLNANPMAASALAEFKRKIEQAKSDGTAMKRAHELHSEAISLVNQYRMTSSGDEFVSIRDGLQRWDNTEASGNWLKDYNPNKARIQAKYLDAGDFAGAVKEWNQFREISNASDLKSRVDSEIVSINILSQQAAEKILGEVGTGADARAKIEEAQPRFMGTDGGVSLKKALLSLK